MSVDTRGVEQWAADLYFLAGVLVEESVAGMTEITLVVETEVAERTPVAGGFLRNSINSEVVVARTGVVEGRTGTNTPYTPYVEEGTDPHFPPLEALVDWVRKKHLAGTYRQGGRRRRGSPAVQRIEDVQVAKRVQRAIGRRGTQAANMFRDGTAAAQPEVDAIHLETMDRVLERFRTRR